MPRKKTVRDIDVEGKTVLVRADFNVTFVPGTTVISDDSRIRATLASRSITSIESGCQNCPLLTPWQAKRSDGAGTENAAQYRSAYPSF